MTDIRIRSEAPADAPAIETVTTLAFRSAKYSSHTEQFIVAALRRAGQLTVSLVAVSDDGIVGHVAASPVTITGQPPGWYGLGPVSVVPPSQGRGIGRQLVDEALAHLRARGAAGCVVLGSPQYYARFGFVSRPTLVLPDVHPEHFQAIAFAGAVPAGVVSYHTAFDATA